MSLQEPAWRVRTRPCLFYQQGRCIFANSCNFLHTTSSQFVQEGGTFSEHAENKSSSAHSTPIKPPLVSVESPHSMHSPRSPRFENLLWALRDVLSEDSDGQPTAKFIDQDVETTLADTSWSASSTAFVNEPISDPVEALRKLSSSSSSSPSHSTSVTSYSNTTSDTNELLNDQQSCLDTSQVHDIIYPDTTCPLLQQPDTHLQNGISTIRTISHPLISSSLAIEGENKVQPLKCACLLPRDDLPSPVEVSHLQLANFAPEHIDDDMDIRHPSTPLALSPPGNPLTSAFAIQASTFGTPNVHAHSPNLTASIRQYPTLPGGESDIKSTPDSNLDSPQIHSIPTMGQDAPAIAKTLFSIFPDRSDGQRFFKNDQIGHRTEERAKGVSVEDIIVQEEKSEESAEEKGGKDDVSFESEIEHLYHEGVDMVNYHENSSRPEVDVSIKYSSRSSSRDLCSSRIESVRQTDSKPSVISDIQVSRSNRNDAEHVEPARRRSSTTFEVLPDSFALTSRMLFHDQTVSLSTAQEISTVPRANSASAPGEQKEAVVIGDESNTNKDIQLAHPGPPGEDKQPWEDGLLTSLYEADSEFSSSSLRESASSIEVQDYRSDNITPEEFSSISTPPSSTREKILNPSSPEDPNLMMCDSSLILKSPLHSQHPFSNSSHIKGIEHLDDESESQDNSRSRLVSSLGDNESKRVPFGWRNSLASNHSSKTSRALQTLRATAKLNSVPSASPPPVDEPPSLSSSPSYPAVPHTSSRLRPLRLSIIPNSQSHQQQSHSALMRTSFVPQHGHQQFRIPHESTSNPLVPLNHIIPHNRSLSSCFSLMSDRMHNKLITPDNHIPSPLTSNDFPRLSNFGHLQSTPSSRSRIWHRASINSTASLCDYSRASSGPSDHDTHPIDEEDDDKHKSQCHQLEYEGGNDHLYKQITSSPTSTSHNVPVQQISRPFYHAISTAKPTLMFAIASDDVAEVKRVLESGDAGPSDKVGPQTALEFALTNEHLQHKVEIVKTLLAYGADPRDVKQQRASRVGGDVPGESEESSMALLMDKIDPAIRYYVERANAPHTHRTSALIHRSNFRPLTRVRYEIIGQDCVLEQLFRVLSIQSRGLSATPIVVLLCGPSGHGKSLLARKFGSLLDVPTHTVNMTTLKSTHDLWQSYSMSPYETPTSCTLAEFLINNEGKRCVVVLDEIEKTGEKTLWSLLMPWELGRCLFEAGNRHIDVRNVVWLGTSNIGHDLVLKHHESRMRPDELMAREEYVELMNLSRPLVSERLGASVLSRVTTVLPFIPFTLEEKRAICSEVLYSLGGEDVRSLSSRTIESVIQNALTSYCSAEGARSLHRAISNQLVDII